MNDCVSRHLIGVDEGGYISVEQFAKPVSLHVQITALRQSQLQATLIVVVAFAVWLLN